jgi:hypothetical protein
MQVRAILDQAGGHDIKVIPCVEAMLHKPVEEILQTPEINWEDPRPADFTRGGAWGSNRVILFAGMKCDPYVLLALLCKRTTSSLVQAVYLGFLSMGGHAGSDSASGV